MDQCKIAIIGAGAVGLAVSMKLSSSHDDIIVFEKEDSFGRHTSSRNSETIHSGIYYPADSLKARLCLKGNSMLYDFMKHNGIDHNGCGKYIIASSEDEIPELERLLQNGKINGVDGLRMTDGDEVHSAEPLVKCIAAVHVPTAGIMDSCGLMKRYETIAKDNGVLFAYRNGIVAIETDKSGYILQTENGDSVHAEVVINSAGLKSDSVAELAGIDIRTSGYELSYCKGEYYKSDNVRKMNMLIYPVPSPDGRSLGIHNRLFMDGSVSFGPNAYYLESKVIDYSMDSSRKDEFTYSLSQFMIPDMSGVYPYDCGIRPKLQKPGEKFRDFVIANESGAGLKNFINLIGIESPGLTSSLAIAEYTAELII